MQQLWSPWRSQYIQTFKDEKPASGCFLCAAAAAAQERDAETLVVARRERCFVIMNRYPYNSGHIMVVPNLHVGKLGLLDEEYFVELTLMVRECESALEKTLKPHAINIGANLGREAGAGVPDHLHFHLVPRWNGDTNFMPVLADIKVVSESLEETRAKLAETLR